MRPEELYEIVDDTPVDGGPVLIQAMHGFVDAGEAGSGFAEHLLAALPHRVVARFDLDQMYDYRGRRPTIVFDKDHFEQYTRPELTLYAMRDDADVEFLLLTGPEPDYLWERFCDAVAQLVRAFSVRLTVSVHGIPMTVPHTRPLGMTSHASRPELVAATSPWQQEITIPASASTLLELRLGDSGYDAMGFAVHVPHYLAENRYPEAVITLLTSVSKVTGLLLPIGNLAEEAAYVGTLVESQVASNETVQQVVRELESQYDASVDGRRELPAPGDLPTDLPTGDEIAAQAEQFLADLENGDEDGDESDGGTGSDR